jgi:3-deoxy-D-arabino-heptulosonate 7-phosphate (DAHP) synthase
VAAGADGLIVEVHNDPQAALSDRDQALLPQEFAEMVRRVRALRTFMEGLS